MTKSDAVAIFDDSQKVLAEALGVTQSAISQWPAVLKQRQIDQVVGAAMRTGRYQALVDRQLVGEREAS